MKFTPGIAVGAMSGSIGGSTASHNRYGTYFRTRAVPTNPNTSAQQNVRSRLATFSALWQTLTESQRLAWNNYAEENPIIDALGAAQVLTGQAAYVGINTRLSQATDTPLTVPPLTAPPSGLLTLSGTWDIGSGTFTLVYTATPLGANDRLWVRAAVVNSPGIKYVKNRLRTVVISAKAQATGLDTQTDIEAVFGGLQVDQVVHVWASVFGSTTGLLSTPLSTYGTVVST